MNFAVGVVIRMPMELQVGTNWADFYAGRPNVFIEVCNFARHMIQQPQIVTAADRDPEEFAPIEDAIEAMRAGEMVIVVDDGNRENEGDLTILESPGVVRWEDGSAATLE